jgi:vanillate O-demethylase ferredoxin subunit
LELRLKQIRQEAEGIHAFEFVSARPDVPLPPFTAGAHLDLQLPGNKIRSYSLANNPLERGRYVVAVQREAQGRGGSIWMHDQLRVGQTLMASAPINDFPLQESADLTVLFAGGIGITPMLAMIHRLEGMQKHWRLHYGARSNERMAYREVLQALDAGRGWVSAYLGDERMDFTAILGAEAASTHAYCCGPSAMLDAFLAATQSRPAGTVHHERFGAAEAPALQGGFEVVLHRSGRRIGVPPGKTILDALLDQDIAVPYACSNGVCGTCLTPVLAGEPEHRDQFLSDEEKKIGQSIILCCSGAKSPVLELDL